MAKGSDVRIVIAQRGWVFVGRYARHDSEVVLTDAKNIRAWGTEKGLGELWHGPQMNARRVGGRDISATVLDEAGTVRLHPLQIIATIDVDAKSWESHLGR